VPHEHAENAGTRRRRPQNRAVALDPLENKIGTKRTCNAIMWMSAIEERADITPTAVLFLSGLVRISRIYNGSRDMCDLLLNGSWL
jgi:hypothetical protein